MNGVLASIVASKKAEVHGLKHRTCYARIPEGPRRNVASSLRRTSGQPLRLIAENKHKSPSAGALSSALTAGERAVAYAESGAAMVSILCDEPFFGGSWHDVVEARVAELAAALGRVDPRTCHVLLSIRADYFGQLERLREHGLERVFADTIALRPLDTKGARAALVDPLAAYGLHLPSKLVETIVRDLGGEGQAVSAVELAIVGDA